MRFVLVSLVFASVSLAQTNPTPKPKPQVVDFEKGTDIDGQKAIPLGALYLAKPDPIFKSLIKVRMSFDDKLRESVHEM